MTECVATVLRTEKLKARVAELERQLAGGGGAGGGAEALFFPDPGM